MFRSVLVPNRALLGKGSAGREAWGMPHNPFILALQYVPRVRTPIQLGALLFVVVAIGAGLWTGQANLLLIVAMLIGATIVIVIVRISWDELLKGVPGRLKGLIAVLVVVFGGLSLLILTVGLVYAILKGGPTANWEEENRRIERARQFFNEKRYTDSLQELKEVSRSNYAGLVLRSRVYIVQGSYGQAEEVLDEATKLKPLDGTAWHNLGYTHSKLGKWELARKDFLQARSLGTDLLATGYMLGLSHYKTGHIGDAENEWRGLAERKDLGGREKDLVAKAHLGLAYIFATRGNATAAIERIKSSMQESLAAGEKEYTEIIRRTICADISNPQEPLSFLDRQVVFDALRERLGKACEATQ